MKRARAEVIKISDLAARREASCRRNASEVQALWARDEEVIAWLRGLVSGADSRSVRAMELLATWRPGDFGGEK